MARLLKYICGGMVIGTLSVLINIHTVTAACANDAACNNGGTCPDTSNDCVCIDGYTDATCDTPPCTDGGSECQNSGTCNTGSATYKCDCAGGYSGYTCTTPPVCTSGGTECQNGGSCNTGSATYVCNCVGGYSGDTCATAKKSSAAAVHLSLMSLLMSLILYIIAV